MPATLAPDQLAPSIAVAATCRYAGGGGLMAAPAIAATPASVVALAPRLLPGEGRDALLPERKIESLQESAAAFAASVKTFDFSRHTIRGDPLAAAQFGQIPRRRLFAHPTGSPIYGG